MTLYSSSWRLLTKNTEILRCKRVKWPSRMEKIIKNKSPKLLPFSSIIRYDYSCKQFWRGISMIVCPICRTLHGLLRGFVNYFLLGIYFLFLHSYTFDPFRVFPRIFSTFPHPEAAAAVLCRRWKVSARQNAITKPFRRPSSSARSA